MELVEIGRKNQSYDSLIRELIALRNEQNDNCVSRGQVKARKDRRRNKKNDNQ